MRHTRAKAVAPNRSRGVQSIALLLCLATWRGPLPWVHDHETDVQLAAGDTTLIQHLTACHARANGHEHGWHLHMLLPFGRCPCSHEDDQPHPVQDPLSVYGTLLTKSVSPPAPQADSAAWMQAAPCQGTIGGQIASVVCPPIGQTLSFLASQLATAPLRAVTGVALC